MLTITVAELFYALLVLALGFFTFRFLMRSNTVNKIADAPLAPPGSDDEVESRLQIVNEDVRDVIEANEAAAEQARGRAKRLRSKVKPLHA